MHEHPANFGDLAFTPAVKATQERLGSRGNYARLEGRTSRTRLGQDEIDFIAARDSVYVATVGENGWPYVQYRGGPRGFLMLLDEGTLGLADFRGNRQYISTGNVLSTGRACLFLMDYPAQERLKIWAEATISEDPALLARVVDPSYVAKPERNSSFAYWPSIGIASNTLSSATRATNARLSLGPRPMRPRSHDVDRTPLANLGD